MITITEGRIFIDGKETIDPTLIGYAVIDAVQEENIIITTPGQFDEVVTEVIKTSFEAGATAARITENIKVKATSDDNR